MSNGNNKLDRIKGIGVAISIAVALCGFAVQWGVVATKLDQVERRLDEMISESKELRSEYRHLVDRVARIEGRMNGRG